MTLTTLNLLNSKGYVLFRQQFVQDTYEEFVCHYFSGKICPICGVINLVWVDYAQLLMDNGIDPDLYSSVARDHTIELNLSHVKPGSPIAKDTIRITTGTGCWDSNFGDDCGSCLNTVINQETALVGPNGMCHD